MSTQAARKSLLEIDEYIQRLFVPRDLAFEYALRDAQKAGLPEIHVSRNEGKLLYLLAKLARAKRILEIGLLGGYSAMWLARAVGSDGRIVTLELDENCVKVARQNLERASLSSRVEIRQGDARITLPKMIAAAEPPFDLVFIDADKASYPVYLDYSLQLIRPGGVILADNVIRDGEVTHTGETDPHVLGIQEFNRKLSAHPKLEAIIVPLVRRGVDGLAIARVKD